MRELWWAVSDGFHDVRENVEEWFFDHKNALYGAAACRIGTGLAVMWLLLANFSSRELWVGPAAIWAEPVRQITNFPELAILNNATGGFVTFFYVVVLICVLAFTLGWHTRIAGVLTLVGYIAIVSQNPIVGGQSDNLIRLTLLWLLIIHSSEYWSLDRRRRATKPAMAEGNKVTALRHAWNGHQSLPPWLSNGAHNIGLAALVAQTVLVYMSAGFSKIADGAWRNGTALYYTMQLPEYRPFPWLTDLLTHSRFTLALMTYAVLLVQLFFAPLLLNKVTRSVVIVLAILVNAFFGVVMSMPVSSLAFIAVTFLFVSPKAWEAIDTYIRDLFSPLGFWLADRWSDLLDRFADLRERKPSKERADKGSAP